MAKKNAKTVPTAPTFGTYGDRNEVLRGQNLRGALAVMERLIDAGKVLDTLDIEGIEVAIQTNVEFDVDGAMEAMHEDIGLHSVANRLGEIAGVDFTDEVTENIVDALNEHIVDVLRTAMEKTLNNLFREGQGLTLHDGFVHVREQSSTLLAAVREGVTAAVEKGQVELRAIERETIKLHNERCAHERVRLTLVAPPVAVAAPVAVAPAPVTAKAPDVSESPTGRLGVPTAPALQNMKPKPRKPKTAPVATTPAKHPVDVAEALAVLADENATPEAIEAALALLA
jgi:hypothetical protein